MVCWSSCPCSLFHFPITLFAQNFIHNIWGLFVDRWPHILMLILWIALFIFSENLEFLKHAFNKISKKTKDWTLDNERTGKVISPSLFILFFFFFFFFFGWGGFFICFSSHFALASQKKRERLRQPSKFQSPTLDLAELGALWIGYNLLYSSRICLGLAMYHCMCCPVISDVSL